MMTTEVPDRSRSSARPAHVRPLLTTRWSVPAATSVGAGAVVAVVAAVASPDGLGPAGIGALLATALMTFGCVSLDLVAGLAPRISLGVALLTYSLQLVVLVAVLASLATVDGGADQDARRWLFAGLAAALLGWVVGHVRAGQKARIPAYDVALPAVCDPEDAGGRP